jgi:hypothetical protein
VHVTFVCLVSRKANDGTDSLGTTRELITYTALLVLLLIVVSFVVLSGGGVFLLWRLFVSLVVSVPYWIALKPAITTEIAIAVALATGTTALDHSRNSTRNRTATIAAIAGDGTKLLSDQSTTLLSSEQQRVGVRPSDDRIKNNWCN